MAWTGVGVQLGGLHENVAYQEITNTTQVGSVELERREQETQRREGEAQEGDREECQWMLGGGSEKKAREV